MAMANNIDAAVKELATSDTTSLYAQLGGYVRAFPTDPAQFANVNAHIEISAAVAGPLDDAIALGKRILNRWNKVAYDLVCGGETAGQAEKDARDKILGALKLNSPEALAAAITGVLISVFSVGPAVAAVVGVLFGKLLLPPVGEEVCSFWKDRL
jgi:hypothetical protein